MLLDALRNIPIIGPIVFPVGVAAAAVSGGADIREVAADFTQIFTPEPEPQTITVINEVDPLTNYYRAATIGLAVTGLAVSIFALTRKR